MNTTPGSHVAHARRRELFLVWGLCLEFLQCQVSSYQTLIPGPGTTVVGLD